MRATIDKYQLLTVAQFIVLATLLATDNLEAFTVACYFVGSYLIVSALFSHFQYLRHRSLPIYQDFIKHHIEISRTEHTARRTATDRGEGLLQRLLTTEQQHERKTTGCFVAAEYKGKPITIGPGGILWHGNTRYCTAPQGGLVPADITIAMLLHARQNPKYLFTNAHCVAGHLTPNEMKRLYNKVYSDSLGSKNMRNRLAG